MEREAARLRELVMRHRPKRPTDGYPPWVRAEVAGFTAQARRAGWGFWLVGEAVGLPATTVHRWAEKALVARPAAAVVQADEGAAAVRPAAEGERTAPATAPACPASRLPGMDGPGKRAAEQQAVSAALVATSGTARAGQVPCRKKQSGAQAPRSLRPVPVVAVADPPGTPAAERSDIGCISPAAAASPGLAVVAGWAPAAGDRRTEGPARLWLESPGGFRLYGLDLASAVALLQALR